MAADIEVPRYAYLITATVPCDSITISPLRPGVDVTCWDCLGWWKQERCATCHPLAFPAPLCIDGREYRRRQRCRK